MAKQRILVVDDEDDLLELIEYNLAKEGYRVHCVGSGEEALEYARRELPDLIVLDLLLPAVDGLDVCRLLKGDEKTRAIPIVMLTAKSEEADMVAGLELGADDYVTKPFSPRILLARIRAVLRRLADQEDGSVGVIRIQDVQIDPQRHEVTVADSPVILTNTEFQLLHFLAKRPGRVFSRDQIVNAIKGDDYPVTQRSVDVHVAGLRKKLGPKADVVDTVRGVGYRIKD